MLYVCEFNLKTYEKDGNCCIDVNLCGGIWIWFHFCCHHCSISFDEISATLIWYLGRFCFQFRECKYSTDVLVGSGGNIESNLSVNDDYSCIDDQGNAYNFAFSAAKRESSGFCPFSPGFFLAPGGGGLLRFGTWHLEIRTFLILITESAVEFWKKV